MLAQQRQQLILERTRALGAVRVADLVTSLDVSDMTIRRDIGELARRGLVQRVHGGAVDSRRAAHEPGFGAKRALAAGQKSAIARAALAHVVPGNAIALSAGTSTHLLAQLVAQETSLRPLTVVTNSLPAAEALHRPEDHGLTVVLVGGTRTPSDALVGPVAVRTLADLRVDLLFLGVHGLDLEAGLTTPNLLEAETDRALVASASRTVVLADHTKWGTVGLSHIMDLAEVDVLICDDALPHDLVTDVQAVVGTLELVAADQHQGSGPPQHRPSPADLPTISEGAP